MASKIFPVASGSPRSDFQNKIGERLELSPTLKKGLLIGTDKVLKSEFGITGAQPMKKNDPNTNEYRVCEINLYGVETEYSIFAARYKFKKGKATFWYWRKNLFNRWELVSFDRELKSVYHLIDGKVIS